MSDIPRAMVLVYQPELTHSVWMDFISRCRTRDGMIKQLRKGVRSGEYVGYRLIQIEAEIMGNCPRPPVKESMTVQKL